METRYTYLNQNGNIFELNFLFDLKSRKDIYLIWVIYTWLQNVYLDPILFAGDVCKLQEHNIMTLDVNQLLSSSSIIFLIISACCNHIMYCLTCCRSKNWTWITAVLHRSLVWQKHSPT